MSDAPTQDATSTAANPKKRITALSFDEPQKSQELQTGTVTQTATGNDNEFAFLTIKKTKVTKPPPPIKKGSAKPTLSFDDDSQSITAGTTTFDPNQLVSIAPSTTTTTDTASIPAVDTNPGADLFFLTPELREKRAKQLIENAESEWTKLQTQTKEESLTVVFSYWDGSGHRFEVTVKKGDSILQFLNSAREVIAKGGFPQLNRMTPDQLIYVKEDLIIPAYYTFYDLIASNARGKSGSLVYFGVKDDTRLKSNALVEKDDAHAGKIMEKSYYTQHKHIFPYNRFETYDPKKNYGKYTIG
jgi:protein FAM50